MKKLQKAFQGLTAQKPEAQALTRYAKELQKIWDDALVGAAENRQQSDPAAGASAAQVRYEIRHPTYTEDDLKNNSITLQTMEVVTKVTGDELGPRNVSLKERVTAYFASLGNNIYTEAFGDVALSNSSVHSEIRHGHTSAKVATYAAIPDVLNSGVVIFRQEKNRYGLERLVVAAPVAVGSNAEKMYVGVMLQRDPQTQRLYLHDAVAEKEPAAQTGGHLSTTGPNGSESELYTTTILRNALNVKKNTEAKPAGALLQKSTHATPIESVSKHSIRPGNEKSNTKFSVRDNKEDIKTVEKYFGTTYNVNEAGYLLTDGKLLDMSGRHEGGPGGYRTVDHRDIADAFDGDYGDGSYSGGMVEFMRAGNIRLSPESGGINLSVKPNKAQLDTLDRYISKFRGEVMVDFDNAAGDTVASAAYRSRTYSKRVIDDINAYFDNGTVPTGNADTWFSVREQFPDELDRWEKDGMPEGVEFTLGSTGPVLQGLGVIESDIYMSGDKIRTILDPDAQHPHPEMTAAEIKKIPLILEDPVLVLKSRGRGTRGENSRLAVFGLIKAKNGQPVMAVMDLRPREGGFLVDDMQKVNSAYTKDNAADFIRRSDVLFADKKRTIPLLRMTGLTIASQQLLRNGYVGSIAYSGQRVKIEGVPFSSVVQEGDTRFSVREAKITDRELLANALETTARNDLERGLLAQYQEKAKSAARWERWLDYHQQKLADHESGAHPLTTQQVLLAREKAAQYAEKLDQLDEKMLKIESMGPMRKLLERERSYVDDLLTGAVAAEKEHFQADFEQRLQEAQRREQESLIQYRERREESERRRAVTAKIERTTRQLADRLNTNTDKKHIPEPLKKPVAQLLTALDYSSRSSLRGDRATRADQEYCRAMEGIRRVLADQEAFQQGAEGSEDALGGYLDLPPGLTDLMTKHIQTVENIIEDRMPTETVLRRMNLTQLKDLDVILSTVTRAVTKMNELLENRTFTQVADAAEDTMAELHRQGQHKGTAEKAETFVAWDNTLPWYAFQRFGQGGRAIFEELQDGWDKLAFNSKQVLDFRQGIITDEQARAWDTEVRQVELLDQEGETVTVSMTTAQLMGLYCLSKRKQALGHLFGGGIRITDIETRGKLRKKTIKQDEHYKMDDQMLGRLLSQLTPEQIAAADKLQKYMTEQGSRWGNEVTMKRFGYRGFTEKIYYPIETDSQDRLSRAGDGTEGSLYRLQNISAVKPLVQNANNAIMLRGIFDVFSNHMADMAKYNALVIPIVDTMKWYNYNARVKSENGWVSTRTVQRSMTKAYGQSANRYVVQFLKDLNGVKESGARGEGFANKMISNYKRAAVAANLRVALLQPTAYVRAAAVLDYKYLAKAFGDRTGTRQATAEMLEHSGIALWKDMGFFDTDVGRSIRDQIKGKGSKLEDLVDKSMAAAELGDKVTWARLWRACKLEVQEKQGLSGDELMKATAQRFRDVIYQTQVIDSTMTRSHMMRSSSTFVKMATSFMSEPTVSYNLIMEGTRQILKDKKAMGLKTAIGRNWKTAGRAYQAYVVSALAAAVVESLADALRDDDDDTLWEKLWNAFGGLRGNLASDLNPLNKLPYMRDVFSALDGYDNGRMDTEGLANAKKAYDILMESYRLATGQQDKATSVTYYGNMTTYGKVYQTFRAVSMLSGLPLSAFTREVITAWNDTVGSAWPGMKCKTYESKKLREAYNSYAKPAGIGYDTLSAAMEYVAALESDKDAEGKTVSGSLKAKYVAYIQSLGLTPSQQKAMWLALKNSTWSDKGTPWE